MRKCPKCEKEIDGPSKICRDCGAILAGADVESPPADPGASLPEVEAAPGASSGESAAEESPDAAPARELRSPWQCPKCSAAVEACFFICWNCGTDRQGNEDPDFRRYDEEVPPNAEASPVAAGRSGHSLKPCPKCGSDRVIPGVELVGHQGVRLKAAVHGKPSALIFKDTLLREILADICGECGHVELRVEGSGSLYKQYLHSLEDLAFPR